ncbi:MAG TPA: hypothetical protein C5S37_04310 [Methanophagales archaeon]|nr:hypothetical protein [Methanophagales archaeon]
MNVEAKFVFQDEEAVIKTIYESIREEEEVGREKGNEDKRRSFVDAALNGNELTVCIRGEDIVIVRAAANTWLRLLKIAEEMIATVDEYGNLDQCQIPPNSKKMDY